MPKLAILGGSPVVDDNARFKSSWRHMPLDSALAEYVGATYARSVGSGTAALVSSQRRSGSVGTRAG